MKKTPLNPLNLTPPDLRIYIFVGICASCAKSPSLVRRHHIYIYAYILEFLRLMEKCMKIKKNVEKIKTNSETEKVEKLIK